MRTTSTLVLFFFLASLCAAQMPLLVKDIYPGIFSGVQTTSNAAVVGNTLYFTSRGVTSGDEELWKTDGTAAGTVLAKDINTGSGTSFQKFRAVFNDKLYLTAQTPALGVELWQTDDIEGAILAAGDPCLGLCSGASGESFVEYNGKLYFRIESDAFGSELWSTDGDPMNAAILKDIRPGTASGYPTSLIVFNGKMYFSADSTAIGAELWVSDGTAGGTHLLKDINTNPFQGSEIDIPVVGTNAFYFWAKDNLSAGAEIWKSDGTAAGTVQLKEIGPGSASGQPPFVPLTNSTWLGDNLLFTADDGVTGAELWMTDGSESGTQLLMDINIGSVGSNLYFFTSWNGKAYFRAKTVDGGNELWVSDGTLGGTQMLKDINPGAGDALNPFTIPNFITHNDKLYFTANNGIVGYELWVTDGTADGTKLVYDLDPGTPGSVPSSFRIMGDFLYFFANTQATGTELWKFPLLTSSTTQPNNHLDLRLYPTISTEGIFYFDYQGEASETLEVRVFDVMGREVYQSKQTTDKPLHIQQLPSGTYFVRMASASGKFKTQQIFIGG